MRRDSWVGGEGWRLGRRVKLPYTTIYGRNWKAWMAFRELYSNTLDEGGETWELEGEIDTDEMRSNQMGSSGQTFIVVHECEDFVQAYRDRASIFIDLDDRPVLAALPGVEVREGQTERLYYQGMRAKDVGKPALHTYNFTTAQDLTEDRQLAYEWQVRGTLANIIAATCEDEALIEKIITADDKVWEHDLKPDPWVKPSLAFHRVMLRRPRGVGMGWGSYYGTHDARPEVAKVRGPVVVLGAFNDGIKRFGVPDAAEFEKRLTAQLAGAKDGRVAVRSGCGHFIMYDEPAWFFEQVEKVLRK